MMKASALALLLLIDSTRGFSIPTALNNDALLASKSTLPMKMTSQNNNDGDNTSYGGISRRNLFMKDLPSAALGVAGAVSLFGLAPEEANAADVKVVTGAESGNLPDLPPEAARSYLQYRVALQVAADYYIFDLQNKVGRIDDWGEINQLFQTNNNRGQGQPNKIERDYTNTMRILGLSMPPDEADEMRDAQFKFERAMGKITKAVSGVRRDLPVEIDSSLITDAKKGWEEGRVALNDFFAVLNTTTGLDEMRLIPAAGPDQVKLYGRSPRRYFELTKKTKLCQNRGGPALSQAWGQLMVSGYLQENMDSCGIPDPVEYFYQ